jgi:hypothetical protein
MATINNIGVASKIQLTATGAQSITIDAQNTMLDGITVQATGNRTLNLTIDSEVKTGAVIIVMAATAGTQTTIAGTGITAPTVTGVAGKTLCWQLVYDGTTFKAVSAAVQID